MALPVFTTQVFENLQNVNQNNMNLFYQDKDEKLTGYFNQVPCICSGIGDIQTNFGQATTTNVFTFLDGTLRFADQETVLSDEVVATFASLTGSAVTVAASASPPGQQYVVAVLTQTQLDAFKVENTVAIATTAMTLAQIAGESNPLAYLPLFAINRSGSTYTVFIDSNCAYNYQLITQDGLNGALYPANVTNLIVTQATANMYAGRFFSSGYTSDGVGILGSNSASASSYGLVQSFVNNNGIKIPFAVNTRPSLLAGSAVTGNTNIATIEDITTATPVNVIATGSLSGGSFDGTWVVVQDKVGKTLTVSVKSNGSNVSGTATTTLSASTVTSGLTGITSITNAYQLLDSIQGFTNLAVGTGTVQAVFNSLTTSSAVLQMDNSTSSAGTATIAGCWQWLWKYT